MPGSSRSGRIISPEQREKIRERERQYRKRFSEKNGGDYHKKWKKENPESLVKYKVKQKRKRLKKLYGLTIDDYEVMVAKQNGRCAICNRSVQELGKNLFIDHNHTTGKIRGLLCSDCNSAIGLLQENAETIYLAAVYVREDGKKTNA